MSRNATQTEVKRSYKRLAFKYHPDRNPENPQAEEKFREISEAYQVLSNPRLRAKYDSFGHMAGEGLFSEINFGEGFDDLFWNLFDEVFNVGRKRSRARQGRDLKFSLELTFDEAAFGVEKEISVPKRTLCPECKGSGAATGGEVICSVCGGNGALRYTDGFFAVNRTCSNCNGRGRKIIETCGVCVGEGHVRSVQQVKVKVPAGMVDGTRLRIRGEGEPGIYGGPNGDLYVEANVGEHPFFSREGSDLFCEVTVTFVQLALGANIEVPILKGKKTIHISPGTQSGQTYRLKGQGLPNLERGGSGDLYVKLQVEVPVNLTSRQKELLRELEQKGEKQQKPLMMRFLDKFQDFLNKQ